MSMIKTGFSNLKEVMRGGGIMSWDIKVYVIIPERIAFGKLLRY